MKNRFLLALCILAFSTFLASCHSQPGNQQQSDKTDSTSVKTSASSSSDVQITFPTGGEKLETGKTYTLKWKGGGDSTITIFLIDSSLESKGASVSISDRIYGLKNTGSYDYTLPTRLESGTYKITIGRASSDYFKIISP